METNKTGQVRKLLEAGEKQKALQLAKTWKLGMTKEERSVLVRGAECITNPDFYRQLGYVPLVETCKALVILEKVVFDGSIKGTV